MDPLATLDRIAAAMTADDLDGIDEACEDLHAWLCRGGFIPSAATANQRPGWRQYTRWVAAATSDLETEV